MMNAYRMTLIWYYGGEQIKETRRIVLCEEEEAITEYKTYTKLYSKVKELDDCGIVYDEKIPFRWKRGKFFNKNKYYMLVDDGIYTDKYKLEDDETLTLEIDYEPYAISMEQLMRQPTEQVIIYLKERGITTCPITK